MRVLGISPLDKDSNVSFMEDGKVLFACGEERLSRVKLQSGFPHRAVQEGLNRLKWDPQSIDAVAYAFFDWDEEARLIAESVAVDAKRNGPKATAKSCGLYQQKIGGGYKVDRTHRIPGIDTEDAEFMPGKAWYKRLLYENLASSPRMDRRAHRQLFKKWQAGAVDDHRKWSGELATGLAKFGLDKKPLRRFQHHDTHAANAFYASPFADALVVTLDGYGSGMCGGVYTADAGGIQNLHRFRFPNSMGIFYEHVTSGLGFKPSRHEGKIVGLASYGDPKHLADILLERFDTTNGDIVIRNGMNHFFTRALSGHFAKRDVAAAYQFVLEEVTRRAVSFWLAKTGKTKVVVSGGVHANVKLNQRIREIPGVEGLFVYPNMGDGGCGTGAAMLAFGHGKVQRGPLENVYYGPDYSDADIKRALDAAELRYERHDDVEEKIGELLATDCIVGRFNGRMEYGPRALGNRSVLYPAKEPEVNQWLNQQLGRTEFMPFAPAALMEAGPRLFKNLSGCEKAAEFMTVTFDCTDEMKRLCPAAVHVDGTARPQLVSEKTNKSFYRIIKAYEARSGIPSVINTSFNMHEEPIICSPEDAVRAFLLGNIDYLAAGSFIVPHPKLSENMEGRTKERAGRVAGGV
jgi:carbamoyltransferase